MASSKTSAVPNLAPRAKVWLEVDGEYVFGLGICRILEAVQETGSLKEAAVLVGKSYRHIWSKVKDVETALGLELVQTQVGGAGARRSQLTPLAVELVQSYRSLRADVFDMVDRRFGEGIQAIIDNARHTR